MQPNPLDHMTLHEQIRAVGGHCPHCARRLYGCSCGGSCPACRGSALADNGFLEARARPPRRRRLTLPRPARMRPAPRPAPRQTPAQRRDGPVGRWRGWSPSVNLQDLLDARARIGPRPPTPAQVRALPARLRPFFRRGVNIYRLTMPGRSPSGYLSIGMTQGRDQTIVERVREHYQVPSRGEPHLYRQMHPGGRDIPPSQITVQAGGIPAGMPPRVAHLYEIWLQQRERVSDWDLIRDTRTFEEEAFADLVAAGLARTGSGSQHGRS